MVYASAKRTIEMKGDHRVPVPPSISSDTFVHGAMDNFDHEENTKSGIGGSHDTVLVLFLNTSNSIDQSQSSLNQKNPTYNTYDQRALNHTLDCQKILRAGKFSERGKIPPNFKPTNAATSSDIFIPKEI